MNFQKNAFSEYSGKVILLETVIDDRYDANKIVTHNKLTHDAVAVIDLELVKDNYTIQPTSYNFIDEVQFFDNKETLWFVEEALRNGVNVVCAGLDPRQQRSLI